MKTLESLSLFGLVESYPERGKEYLPLRWRLTEKGESLLDT